MEISGASATQFFGSPSTESLFTAGQTAGATEEQQTAAVIISAQKREINRIKGYKIQLTPADNQRLSKVQAEIQAIEAKASNGTVRSDELEDRTELYAEADRIIGKPSADADADAELAKYATAMQTLLSPKLSASLTKRVEYLERVKEDLKEQFNDNGDNETLRRQFQSISRLLTELTPPRPISQLSRAETKAYNDLADLINEHAGVDIQLSSRDAIRVEQLEKTVVDMQANLGPDPSQQPTPQAVARAYTRLA